MQLLLQRVNAVNADCSGLHHFEVAPSSSLLEQRAAQVVHRSVPLCIQQLTVSNLHAA